MRRCRPKRLQIDWLWAFKRVSLTKHIETSILSFRFLLLFFFVYALLLSVACRLDRGTTRRRRCSSESRKSTWTYTIVYLLCVCVCVCVFVVNNAIIFVFYVCVCVCCVFFCVSILPSVGLVAIWRRRCVVYVVVVICRSWHQAHESRWRRRRRRRVRAQCDAQWWRHGRRLVAR